MEVKLPPDLQSKLDLKAAQEGRDSETLVREAIERTVDYDAWFVREVEAGLAAAERGEFVDHEDIASLIGNRYPG